MKIKINENLICIPPYISATWDQVTLLQSEEDEETKTFTLIIHLSDGKIIHVPELDASLIDIAFTAHMKYLEEKGEASAEKTEENEPKTFGAFLQQLTGLSPDQLANMPIRLGITGMDGMEVFQHNQAQANSPDMPPEVLEKIAGMAKMMTNGDLNAFPKPEPHCNCPHCQVARAIHGMSTEEQIEEESVSDEELQFRDWNITKNGDQLYVVSNPLNPKEQYSVYLGTPVGCTCGQSHCEHIKAVLYS